MEISMWSNIKLILKTLKLLWNDFMYVESFFLLFYLLFPSREVYLAGGILLTYDRIVSVYVCVQFSWTR
jgi:hypothetical protein